MVSNQTHTSTKDLLSPEYRIAQLEARVAILESIVNELRYHYKPYPYQGPRYPWDTQIYC